MLEIFSGAGGPKAVPIFTFSVLTKFSAGPLEMSEGRI